MEHYDEHTLELFVLGAKRVQPLYREIQGHLSECHGCRTLVEQLREIHSDLANELEMPAEPISPEKALTRRRQEIAHYSEHYGASLRYTPRTPMQRLRYYIFNYPVAATVVGISFAVIFVGIGMLLSIPFNQSSAEKPIRDTNPSYPFLNASNGMFEVRNRSHELLWSLPVKDLNGLKELEASRDIRRSFVFDIDGDGRNDIVTSLTFIESPMFKPNAIHVISADNVLIRDITFPEKVEFRGDKYQAPMRLDGFMVLDTSTVLKTGFYASATNDRSPCTIVRFDINGKVIGQYWHFGNLFASYLHDIDGDGKKELILCMINNVDDHKILSSPAVVVLDPERLVGNTESTATRGFGFPASDAELYYVRLPLSDINTELNIHADASHFQASENTLHFFSSMGIDSIGYEFEFVFDRSLTPIDVKPTSRILTLYSQLKRKGIVKEELNQAYRHDLKDRIRFWDGKQWTKGVTRVRSVQSAP